MAEAAAAVGEEDPEARAVPAVVDEPMWVQRREEETAEAGEPRVWVWQDPWTLQRHL